MTRIGLRADASVRTGTGHLRRCLALAHALRASGAEPVFICRPLDGTAASVLHGQPFRVHWLPAGNGGHEPSSGVAPDAEQARDAEQTARASEADAPAWMLVDHYALDARWHRALATRLSCRVAAIDDLADRPLACELVVDPNWHPDPQSRYEGWLQRSAILLAGPRYALLGAAYRNAVPHAVHPKVRSIGVFLGGTDAVGVSADAVAATRDAGFDGPVEVATTSANPGLRALRERLRADGRASLLVDAEDLSAFFARHDLQIGAGGGASWERCCMGAPTVAVVVADNQREVAAGLQSLGALAWAEPAPGESLRGALSRTVSDLLSNPAARRTMAQAGRHLVDGWGALRVASRLARDTLVLRPRPAVAADEALLLDWANDPQVRAQSFHPGAIAREDHHRWFQARMAKPARSRLYIPCTQAGLPAGQVRFDLVEASTWRINYALEPSLRGMRLGTELLECAIEALVADLGNSVQLVAQVKDGNSASQKVFSGLQFDSFEDATAPAGATSWRRKWPRPAGGAVAR